MYGSHHNICYTCKAHTHVSIENNQLRRILSLINNINTLLTNDMDCNVDDKLNIHYQTNFMNHHIRDLFPLSSKCRYTSNHCGKFKSEELTFKSIQNQLEAPFQKMIKKCLYLKENEWDKVIRQVCTLQQTCGGNFPKAAIFFNSLLKFLHRIRKI